MVDMSTPMTCLAPALTANLLQITVSVVLTDIRREIGTVRVDRLHVDWTDIHAEDGCTASNVQDDFVFEDVLVVVDGISVGACADFIFLFNRLVSDGSTIYRIAVNQPTFLRGCLRVFSVSSHSMRFSGPTTDHDDCSYRTVSKVRCTLHIVFMLILVRDLPVEVMHLAVRHACHRIISTEFGDGRVRHDGGGYRVVENKA